MRSIENSAWRERWTPDSCETEIGILQQAIAVAREVGYVSECVEVTSLFVDDQVTVAGNIAGQHWDALRHGFENGVGLAFVQAAFQSKSAALSKLTRIGALADEANRVLGAAIIAKLLQAFTLWAIAYDDQPGIAMGYRHQFTGPDQILVTLLRPQSANCQNQFAARRNP